MSDKLLEEGEGESMNDMNHIMFFDKEFGEAEGLKLILSEIEKIDSQIEEEVYNELCSPAWERVQHIAALCNYKKVLRTLPKSAMRRIFLKKKGLDNPLDENFKKVELPF